MEVQSAQSIVRQNKLKLIWGLVCLVAPTLLIILSIMLYALSNFISGTVNTPSNGELFGQSSPAQMTVNIATFVLGAISTTVWLPGIIVGIVLLATRKPVSNQQ